MVRLGALFIQELDFQTFTKEKQMASIRFIKWGIFQEMFYLGTES